jgi:anti-sigma B factor antagonist
MSNTDFAVERRSRGSDNLTIQTYGQDARRTLILTGELDLGSAPMLEDTVVRACADGASELVLELSQLEFIDATGLDAVLSAKTVAARLGCSVFLTPREASDRRAFELVRLADYLPFRRSSRAKPADPSFEDYLGKAQGRAQLISAWD